MEIIEPIRYSIVIPLYNEEHSVRALYARIVEAMEEFDDPYQIIFVDDGKLARETWLRVDVAA